MKNSYKKAKKIYWFLLLPGTVLSALSVLFGADNPLFYLLFFVGVAVVAIAIVAYFHYGKCPFCGMRPVFPPQKIEKCPHCGKALDT